jgi:hypothetical protein
VIVYLFDHSLFELISVGYAALSNDTALRTGGQYVDALCQPLLDKDNPVDSKIVQEKIKALQRADEKWATRLWDVSLCLLQASPARDVIRNVPASPHATR